MVIRLQTVMKTKHLESQQFFLSPEHPMNGQRKILIIKLLLKKNERR